MLNLPDELVLKILGYAETKDLITCGQVSKRIRKISHDDTLWVAVNFVKKIVKTELLEVVLSKGCKILKISNSIIVGSLSSNVKSQLTVLEFSRSVLTGTLPGNDCGCLDCAENIDVLEKLLFLSRSLQDLKIEGFFLTPKMACNICDNGQTLQVLNINHSHIIDHPYSPAGGPLGNLQIMIKFCQELKELSFITKKKDNWLREDDLDFLARNISPNIVKLNLSNHNVQDNLLKILLSRCNKIKVLILIGTFITSDSLKTIRLLKHSLEELTVSFFTIDHCTDTSILELKSMPSLQILNLYTRAKAEKRLENLRQHLPQLMIRTFSDPHQTSE